MNMPRLLLLLAVGMVAMNGVLADDKSPAGQQPVERDQLIILVRHAEKALDQGNDPGLTEDGAARARSLNSVLGHAGVGAIITTEWQRTRLTAAPLAKTLGIDPIVLSTVSGDAMPHPKRVAEAVRALPAEVVLIVGHSNTVPQIILALGGPQTVEIGDADYSNLFLLWRREGKARLVRSQY